MRRLRLCLGLPGQPCGEYTTGSRCPRHDAEIRARRGQRRNETSTYQNAAWRRVSRACIARDGQCLVCGALDWLHAHHIVARRDGGADVLSNLMTLCGRCHGAYEGAVRRGDERAAIVLRVDAIGALIRRSS